MSIELRSGSGSTVADVDAASAALRTSLYDTAGNALAKTFGEDADANDGMLIMGGKNDDNYRVQRMDRLGSQSIALNNVLLHEPFEGTTVATTRFAAVVATMVQAQTTVGGLDLNSTSLVGAGNASLLYSLRQFHKFQRAPMQAKFRLRAGHVTNAVMEWGFGNTVTSTTSPTTGAYFQVTSGGIMQGVLTFNGVDVNTTAIDLGPGWQNNYYTYDIIVDDDEVVFFVQNTASGLIIAERRLQLSATQQRLWSTTKLAVFARQHNVTAPATAPKLVITSLDVIVLDMITNKTYAQTACLNGGGLEALPTTFAQASTHVHSTAPGSTALAAAGPGLTTLGGYFQFAALAGAATDYVLFGFQVPAPYTLVVTGIEIDSWNLGAAVATTPTLLVFSASPDMAAVTLASGTQRRIVLGAQSFKIGAAIGERPDKAISINREQSPIITNPGRFFDIVLRIPVGTATASQLIQGFVTISGYYE